MKRAWRWILGTAGLLLLAAIVLFMVSRLRGPDAEERAALALMDRQDTPPGRNAFAAMWLLKYDMPEARQEEIAAEDVRRFGRTPVPTGTTPDAMDQARPFESLAARSYPALELNADEQRLLCQLRDTDCLAKARNQREALAALVEKYQRLVERTRALERYDYIRSAFPTRLDAPFALPTAVEGLRLVRTADALAFVDGRQDEALGKLCRSTRPWRRFLRNSDTLLDQMISLAAVDGAMELFADMLAELPAAHPLPYECGDAFAPAVAEELSLCRSLRGEFRFASEMAAQVADADSPMGSWQRDLAFPLMFDEDRTRALSAVAYARACAPEMQRQIASDQPVQWPRSQRSPFRFACWGNYAGCVIAETGASAFDRYQHRLQDLGAKLRLLDTVLWLRGNADDVRPLAVRLEERPQELRSAGRDIEITDEGRALRVAQFETARAQSWSVPLPAEVADRGGFR